MSAEAPVPGPSGSSGARWGRSRRRRWARHGVAYIELKGSRDDRVGRRVRDALRHRPDVRWAATNQALARVVVGFDDGVELDDLIQVVEEVEDALGVGDERFPFDAPSFPCDAESTFRPVAALVADTLALGASGIGTIADWTPLPIEAASAISLIDSHPRARRALGHLVGSSAADLALSLGNAFGQAVSHGPVALGVDVSYRVLQLRDVRARHALWCDQQASWSASGARHEVTARPAARPVPLPPGPVERYADRAALVSLGGFGVALLATRSPRRSAGILLAAAPKPARLGREAFAAALGHVLASRGILAMGEPLLRHLDRVDTVVVPTDALLTGRYALEDVRVVDGEDRETALMALDALFDVHDPTGRGVEGRWSLRPRETEARRGTHYRLDLFENDRRVATCVAEPELRRGARELVRSARSVGLMVAVAGGDVRLVRRVGASMAVDADITAAIRGLQCDGCCVALIGSTDASALLAADCGIAITDDDGPAWGADLLGVTDLDGARFVVEAIGVAEEASRQSVAVAIIGSSIGSLIALNARLPGGNARAMLAVNAAAGIAVVNGWRVATRLSRHWRPLPDEAPPWHSMEIDATLQALSTSREGLSAEAATQRQEPKPAENGDGSSVLGFARAFADEVANPLTPVLAAGAAAAASVGSLVDAAMVGTVMGVNSLVGAAQRVRASHALRGLEALRPQHARVRREGEDRVVDAHELVPGDVIVLEAGDLVPADARLLAAEAVEVDESSLTGESLPVPKAPGATHARAVADRTSMLYAGTTIAAGDAVGVVVATGSSSELTSVDREPRGRRPAQGVEGRLEQLGRLTIPTVLGGGAALVAAGLLRGRSLRDTLNTGVSLAVAAVPEGLPILATLAQLSAARRLAASGALVRNVRAVEALGRLDVLCIDKTGTLTEGRITLHSVSDGCTVSDLRHLTAAHRAVLVHARRATPEPNGNRSVPHATDRAVLEGTDLVSTDQAWERGSELPFEAARGYHATAGRVGDAAQVSVKGAPEVILPRCRDWRTDDGARMLDDDTRAELTRHFSDLARSGQRVLAVAFGPLPSSSYDNAPADEDLHDLTLLGFVGLSDPVRPEAASAVTRLQQAGVGVVMVTGDHPSTAAGIAAELGLVNGHRAVTGDELDRLSDPALDEMLDDISVFARVTPAHKSRIVTAFQRVGRPVAMTGDGANDAPAIRLADVGIAIGERSTPAARDAADVVITTERIESIVDAVIEGRGLWRSLREALAILIGGNLGEMGFTVAVAAVAGRAPLSPRQLLIVNLLTDIAPALAVANRPPAVGSAAQLLAEGPDQSLGAALRRAIAVRAATTGAGATVAYTAARWTGRRQRASTVGLVALVGTQLGQTLVASDGDRGVLLAGLASTGALLAIVETPGLSQLAGCTPLGPVGLSIALGSAAAATAASSLLSGLLSAPAPQIPDRALPAPT